MNKTIIYIILAMILGAGLYWGINQAYAYIYQQGTSSGAIQVIQKINADGLIPVINNQTIQYIPIKQICGSLG